MATSENSLTTSTDDNFLPKPRYVFGIRDPVEKRSDDVTTANLPVLVLSAERANMNPQNTPLNQAVGPDQSPGHRGSSLTSLHKSGLANRPTQGPLQDHRLTYLQGTPEPTPAPLPPPGNYRMVPLKRNGKGYLLEDNHVFIKSNERNGTFYLKCLAWRHCGARAKIDNKGHAKITTKHDNHDPPDLLSLAFRARVLRAARLPKYSNLSVAQVYHKVRQDSIGSTEQHPTTQGFPQLGSMKTSISRVRMAASPPKRKKTEHADSCWPIVPLGFKIESISRRLVHKAEAEQAKEMLDFDMRQAALGTENKNYSPVLASASPSSVLEAQLSSLITPPPDDPREWWKNPSPAIGVSRGPPSGPTVPEDCQPLDLSTHNLVDFDVNSDNGDHGVFDHEDLHATSLMVDEPTSSNLRQFKMEELDYFSDSTDSILHW